MRSLLKRESIGRVMARILGLLLAKSIQNPRFGGRMERERERKESRLYALH